jgi:hypothetical protein
MLSLSERGTSLLTFGAPNTAHVVRCNGWVDLSAGSVVPKSQHSPSPRLDIFAGDRRRAEHAAGEL